MITQLRKLAAAQLTDLSWPVYNYKPDNVNEVPCIVVDRPSVDINVQHHTVSLPIVVIGRRDNSEDAQTELDDTASDVARQLAGPEFAVERIEPAVAVIAELTYPAYRISVSCGVTYCPERNET